MHTAARRDAAYHGGVSVGRGRGRTVRLLAVDEPGLISGQGNDRHHPDECGEGWPVPPPSEYRDVARDVFNSSRWE